jgi:hypothetical protein
MASAAKFDCKLICSICDRPCMACRRPKLHTFLAMVFYGRWSRLEIREVRR